MTKPLFSRNITSRDFCKLLTCEQLLKTSQLPASVRYEQARFAQSVRNFWFTATGQQIVVATSLTPQGQPISIASTPRFSEPVIITDVLAMVDYKYNDDLVEYTRAPNLPRFNLTMTSYGGESKSLGEDFFGLTGPVGQEYITRWERNDSIGILTSLPQRLLQPDAKLLPFVPRLLAPYETIQIGFQSLTQPSVAPPFEFAWNPQLWFRAVRVIREDNPYRYFSNTLERRIQNQIRGAVPETFYLDLEFPHANLPVLNGPAVTVKTPQMDRPLLVLGASCNVEGLQADLWDDSKYYQFTHLDEPLASPKFYQAPPLNMWCPRVEHRNNNSFNMFPVPHLLEPDAMFRLELFNGLNPQLAAAPPGSFVQEADTENNQPVRITFICRSV